MITCETSSWWRRHVAAGQVVALVGGAAIVAIAILAHTQVSVALLVIGGIWIVMGAVSWLQVRRVAFSVVFDEGTLTFVGPHVDRQVSATALATFRWQYGDINRLAGAFFITTSGEKVRVAPRMTSMLELFTAVKQRNVAFSLPRI